MLRKPRKRRIPALKFTKTTGIGWHVSFRDAVRWRHLPGPECRVSTASGSQSGMNTANDSA